MRAHLEVERRFLVREPSVVHGTEGIEIAQVYLFADEHTVLRVGRRHGGWRLTVKDSGSGLVRREYHAELPEEFGTALFASSSARRSVKRRYLVPYAGREWLVDVYRDGPVLAEVELPAADAELAVPAWCGAEVTGDPAYADHALARKAAE
ncbi:CYTH domain-containing protein [Streptomyces fuscichromogenes]|uniref:CYTH domain-containing protein n=1 Tax=Streptomyces fuscichromogenes TaxID=1324013 RepID=A0A917XH46_9ACTN|nr:adenylate cyclase [Streptomyces fuscichromogenes]GGN21634.1 CYTH domain-containing protein [Streptomyces fuscichromogenes]